MIPPLDRVLALASRVPAADRALWRRASGYVGGRGLDAVLATTERLLRRGARVSVERFGTPARDRREVRAVVVDHVALARAVRGRGKEIWLSLDLTPLGVRLDRESCVDAVAGIADALGPGARVQIGAEEPELADDVLAAVIRMADQGLPVMATLQANLRRADDDADRLVAAGVPVRLVKGAFPGHAAVAWPRGEQVDLSFVRLAHRIHGTGGELTLATHDRVLREALLLALPNISCEVSFGVRDGDVDALVGRGVPTRVHVAYGPEWLRFYLRRLAEAPRGQLR